MRRSPFARRTRGKLGDLRRYVSSEPTRAAVATYPLPFTILHTCMGRQRNSTARKRKQLASPEPPEPGLDDERDGPLQKAAEDDGQDGQTQLVAPDNEARDELAEVARDTARAQRAANRQREEERKAESAKRRCSDPLMPLTPLTFCSAYGSSRSQTEPSPRVRCAPRHHC